VAELESDDGVRARIAELCATARAAHPTLQLDDAELTAAIAKHCPPANALAYLASCRADDLALTVAAGRGDRAAIAQLEADHDVAIAALCRQFATPAATADDLRQQLREKLFVGPAPKIVEYSGAGQLRSWLRVTATRLFLDLRRRKDRARESPSSDSGIANMLDPADLELEVIKAEYREAVRDAMHASARRLAPSDRHVLRQHLIVGLTIDQLAVALGVHRATAARRIQRAREQLVAYVREELATQLAVDPERTQEVLAAALSRIDVSIGKLLASRR
jgi:RNA polymerase sigma-70 factor (ECF subfamily)